MPIDFDPLFHTETMVRILREQGSTQYAMELAEKILEVNPDNQAVRQLLTELKEEARKNFERFKNSGKVSETPEETAEEEPSPGVEGERVVLHLVKENKPPSSVQGKVQCLGRLLKRIQDYGKSHETPPA